eukprot:154267-Prorocentrum_minimum.AAC.1
MAFLRSLTFARQSLNFARQSLNFARQSIKQFLIFASDGGVFLKRQSLTSDGGVFLKRKSLRQSLTLARDAGVLQVYVNVARADEAPLSSRLTLVDLAGSERASLTGAGTGQLVAESIAINKSLFTLRKVRPVSCSNHE